MPPRCKAISHCWEGGGTPPGGVVARARCRSVKIEYRRWYVITHDVACLLKSENAIHFRNIVKFMSISFILSCVKEKLHRKFRIIHWKFFPLLWTVKIFTLLITDLIKGKKKRIKTIRSYYSSNLLTARNANWINREFKWLPKAQTEKRSQPKRLYIS